MKIILIEPHRHHGVLYAAGSLLEVYDFTGEWLIKHKVAQPAPQPQGSVSPTPPRRNAPKNQKTHA